CVHTRAKPNYRLLLLLLVVLPGLSLQRGMLVFTGLLLTSVFVCVERARRATMDPSSLHRPKRHRHRLAAIFILGCALLGAIKIGDIRSKQYYQQLVGDRATQNSLQQ